jgi:DNA-binding HxlR family transcriptional regulator
MRRFDTSHTGRVSRVIELLQGKWTVQVLYAMRARPVRLSELKRVTPSASKKGLTASLRSLETARVVLRRDLSNSVLHVAYELAGTMQAPLIGLSDHLAEWGKLCDAKGSESPDCRSKGASNLGDPSPGICVIRAGVRRSLVTCAEVDLALAETRLERDTPSCSGRQLHNLFHGQQVTRRRTYAFWNLLRAAGWMLPTTDQ